MVKVGINGFGRIGRLVLRAAMERKYPELEFVAINDIASVETNAYLLKYDSNYGIYPGTVSSEDGMLLVDGKKIAVSKEKDPANLPWGKLGVGIVVESTGKFTEAAAASGHLTAGARKVLISAPAKGEDVTLVMGVNDSAYDPARHRIISNASCTTNCLGPMAKVLVDTFGVKRGLMTTIHSYTNDQRVLDIEHKDLRRARAAALSMIPTTTGAAKAIGLVIPSLNKKMNGLSIRVPTPTVSLVDLVAELEKPAEPAAINAAMKAAAEGPMKGILQYCDEPLVSRDFTGNPHSCIFDATSTYVIDGVLAKVMGWYDNEWAYSCRVVDLLRFMAKMGNV